MKKSKPIKNWRQLATLRLTRIHFLFAIAFALQIIIYDSWNLIAHEAVSQRWTAIGVILVLDLILWFLAKIEFDRPIIYISMTMALVVADIILASLCVYWERGMASTSVILFVLALISSSILRSRTLLLLTAALCSVAYSTTIVRYFNSFYGEGFRVQLWGEVGFYSALFFIFALILMVALGTSENS